MRHFTQKLAVLLMTLMCCIGMPQAVMAQDDCKEIGTGTSANNNLPISSYYHNSYSQQLYLADEIDHSAGNISSIAFAYTASTSTTRTISIYMANTDVTSLSSSYVTEGFEEVLSPTVVEFANDDDWFTIDLETPFAYDGTSNLVVAVYMNYAQGETGYDYTSRFAYTSLTGMGRYTTNDTQSADQLTITDGVWTSGGSTYSSSYRPNVKFCFGGSAGPVCEKPSSITYSGLTSTSVTLVWAGGSGEYNVEYKAVDADKWTSLLEATNLLTVDIPNLTPNTSYKAHVQSTCAGGDKGWKEVSFKTPCSEITTFPWSENFDDMTTYGMPDCWDNAGSTSSPSTAYYLWGVYSYSGHGKVLYLYNSYCPSGVAQTHSPSLSIPVGAMYELEFEYYHTASCGAFTLNVSDDGGNTWAELGSYAKNSSFTTASAISLASYAGKTIMLQFKANTDYSSGSIYIDNISVYDASCVIPSDLAVSNITKTSVDLDWTANGEETQWQINYKKSSDTNWTTKVVSEHPFTLDELVEHTSYDVCVYAKCDDNLSRKASNTVTFTTAAGVPFAENFNTSMPSDWTQYKGLWDADNGAVSEDFTQASAGWSVSSGNGVFTETDNHLKIEVYGSSRQGWLVTPTIVLEDNLQLSFDLALTKYSGTLQPVAQNAQPDDKFIVFVTTDNGESWNELMAWDNANAANSYDGINCSATGQKIVIDFSKFDASFGLSAGNSARFAFYAESTEGPSSGDGDNNLHIDNFLIDVKPDCQPTTNLTVSGVTHNTAVLTWEEVEDGPTSWEVGCVKNPAANYEPADADFTATVTGLTVTIDTLSENSSYIFILRGVCGGAKSAIKTRTFTTKPAPLNVPWSEDFEEMTANTLPEFWDNSASTSTAYYAYYIWGVYSYNSNKMLRMYNFSVNSGTALINTPSIALPASPAYELTFDYSHRASCGAMSVNISEDGGVSWTEIKSCPKGTSTDSSNPGTFSSANVNLASYAGKTVMLQFSATADYSSGAIFLDNVDIHELPSCPKPSDLKVSEATNAITTHSVELEWTEGGSESAWILQYKKNGAAEWSEKAVGTNPFVLDELDAASTYYVRVAASCAGDEVSAFCDSIAVTTACDVISSFPWNENFEGMTASTFPLCWDNSASTTSDKESTNVWGVYSYSNNKMIRMNNFSVQTGSALTNTPSIVLPAEPAYELTFKYSHTATCGNMIVKVSIDGTNWTELDSYAKGSGSSYTDPGEFTEAGPYSLAAYAGQTILIQFYAEADYGSGAMYVDDISIHEIPSCLKPTGLISVLTPGDGSVATLAWTPAGEEEDWTVEYSLNADFSEAISVNATDTFVNVASLTAEKTYYARVKAVCGENNESEWANVITFVPTNAVTQVVNNNTTTGNYVPFDGYDADGGDLEGQFIIPADSLTAVQWGTINKLTFHANTATASWGSAKFEVYVAETSATSLSALTDVTTMTKVKNAAALSVVNSEMEVTFDTPFEYEDGNLLIAFKQTVDGSSYNCAWLGATATTGISYYGYWDYDYWDGYDYISSSSNFAPKVSIAYLPGVAPDCMKPTGLHISAITAEGATLTWDNIENGAWKYAVALASAGEPADEAFIAIADTMVVIAGKADNTDYIFYLRQDCSASEDGLSQSISVPFHTNQLPAAVPFSDDFELGNKWLFVNGDRENAWVYGEAAHNGEGTHALYISNDGGTTNAYNNNSYAIVYATKLFTFAAGNYSFQYDWKAAGESCCDFLRVALVPADAELVVADSYSTVPANFSGTNLPTGWVALDGGSKLNNVTTWQTFTSEEIEIAAGTYKVVFAWKNDGSNGPNPPIAVDNFSIAKVSCSKQSALVAKSPSAHKATLSWKAAEGQNAWQIALDTIAAFNPDTVNALRLINVTDTPYVATGLLAAKTYYAYVRSDCGEDGLSAWNATKATFTTLAATQAPTDLAVNTSSLTSEGVAITWKGVATNDYHASFEVLISKNSTLPETPASDSLTLGLTAAAHTFTGLDAQTTYYVWVRDNCGEDGYSAWVGGISFTTLADCSVPGGLYAENETGHTVDLAWTIGNNEKYNVRYRIPAGDDPIFTEGFENGIGDWTMTNCHTSTGITTSAKRSNTYGFSFRYSTNPPQYLISPEISGVEDGAKLEFWYKNSSKNNAETFEIGFSSTDTEVASFTFGAEKSVSDAQWHLFSEAIPVGTKYICWKYTANNQYYLYIDDIVVSNPTEAGAWVEQSTVGGEKTIQIAGLDPETTYEAQVQGVCGTLETEWSEALQFTTTEACVVPANVTVSDLAKHGAKLSWQSNASAWQICLNGDEENLIDVAVVDTPYVFTTLAGETAYTVKVRANCTAAEDGYSEWSAVKNFTTLVSCDVPTGLKVSEIAAHSARIEWKSEADAFELSLNGDTVNLIQVSDTFVVIDTLRAATAYSVKVRANCGSLDGKSKWTSVKNFTTECESITTFPWNENFNKLTSGIPTCWDNTEGTTTTASYRWNYYAVSTDTCVRFNSYYNSSNLTNFLATPAFELTEGLELTFDWKNPAGGDAEIFISTDGGTTKTSLLSEGLTSVSDWKEIIIDLSAYAGQTAKIYFKGISNCGYNDAYLYLDNVSIHEIPSCAKPTDFKKSNEAPHGATLSWISEADAWQIAIDSIADFDPDTLSAKIDVTVTDTPYVATGLKAEKTYYAYVRANCGTDGFSEWSSRVSFTTLVACPAPTGLKATLTAGEGSIATLSWKESGEADAWVVEYATDNTFANAVSENVSETHLDIDNLTAETKYYARVKAVCGGEDGESAWSAVISFTPTNAYSFTINEGDVENDAIPIYGMYADYGTKSQFVIPAADLAQLGQNDTIQRLTFFAKTSSAEWSGDAFEVYMLEVADVTLTDTLDWATMTSVMAAAELSINNYEMVVNLTAPYAYQGGNLLIGFNEVINDSYSSCTWYGVQATSAAVNRRYNYYHVMQAASVQNFLPKMKIEFTPYVEPGPGTGLFDGNAGTDNKAVKFFFENKVYIRVNGAVYDATGRKVEMK